MDFEALRLEKVAAGVTILTLHRPDHLNAINHVLIDELHHALAEIDNDDTCRVVILTGAGRAFCAGLDLNGYGDDEAVEGQGGTRRLFTRQREIAGIAQRLLRLRQPVIAAVNGPAAGGGLALVLASDIRIAGDSALFAVSFIRAGYSACDIGTSWLLPRMVGAGRAHELMLTGRRFGPDEAERIGLLSRVVRNEELREAALTIAAEIQLSPPLSVQLTKQGMWIAMEIASFDATVEFENRQQVITALTEDQSEATRAFLDKRTANYRYR